MRQILAEWYQHFFNDTQAVVLTLLALALIALTYFAGDILLPIFVAIGLAYLLEGSVSKLESLGMRRIFAISFIFLLSLALTLISIIGIAPLLSRQMSQFIRAIPRIMVDIQTAALDLFAQYGGSFSEELINNFNGRIENSITSAQHFLFSFDALYHLGFGLVIYLLMVPIISFFLLKDKDVLLSWIAQYLPKRRHLMKSMWSAFDLQLGNYIRGKAYQIVIISCISFLAYKMLGLNFSSLLGFVTGLSVLLPYIGAVAASIPVALVAYFQWGIDNHFVWVMIAYAIIQFLDGNILSPLLFSKINRLHPVVIIFAVLVFAGLFGFWGALFAIPLATLIKITINLWPVYKGLQNEECEKEEGDSATTLTIRP